MSASEYEEESAQEDVREYQGKEMGGRKRDRHEREVGHSRAQERTVETTRRRKGQDDERIVEKAKRYRSRDEEQDAPPRRRGRTGSRQRQRGGIATPP